MLKMWNLSTNSTGINKASKLLQQELDLEIIRKLMISKQNKQTNLSINMKLGKI